MRSHLPGNKDSSSKPHFFEAPPPPQQQGGTSTAKGQGGKAVEDSDIPHNGRDPSGTNEHIDTYGCSKLFDNRFQKYTAESPSTSGYNPPKTSKLSPSWETSSLPTKLVEGNPGPLGPNTIQGYLIDFSSSPHQPVTPHCPQYSAEQTHLISEEITKLLQKGAIGEIVPVKQPGFYSNVFLANAQ